MLRFPFPHRAVLLLVFAALSALAPSLTAAPRATFLARLTAAQNEFPESIAVDRQGNFFLSCTFTGKIKKVTPNGHRSDFATISDEWILGVTFDAAGNLTVAGVEGIWKVAPNGTVSLFAAVPGHESLNDLVYDACGNLYVSDDTKFVVWKIDGGGRSSVWSADPLFAATNPSYPFLVGCNGVALSCDERTLFVTNTSDGLVLAVPIHANGSAGRARVLASGSTLIGVDGLKCTASGDLLITQNIGNQILRLPRSGPLSVVFEGTPLSFPTSLVLGLTRAGRPATFICNNGDAFFSETPSGQGVLQLEF